MSRILGFMVITQGKTKFKKKKNLKKLFFYHSNSSYRFFNFNHIDYFNYFSHFLVTIPPPAWTNICHQFGVLSLGVIITEGEGGVSLNYKLLQGHNNNRI